MPDGGPTNSALWLWFGWLMVHFLWLGLLVGLAGRVLRGSMSGAKPETRYLAALFTLALLVISPFAAAALVERSPASLHASLSTSTAGSLVPAGRISVDASNGSQAGDLASVGDLADTRPLGQEIQLSSRAAQPRSARWPERFQQQVAAMASVWIPWLPALWLCGAPLALAHLLLGIAGTRRLRHACEPASPGIVSICDRLHGSLRGTRKWSVAICDRVAGPLVVGVLRPVVLLPAAAVSSWNPEQIEMALLHEFAHIRRHDNLVNVVQRFAESVLFFHPAIWWASRWVRLEREHCCDAYVVAQTSQPGRYARFLAELFLNRAAGRESTLRVPLEPAVFLAEGAAVVRIREILQAHQPVSPIRVTGRFHPRNIVLGGFALLVVTSGLVGGAWFWHAGSMSRQSSATAAAIVHADLIQSAVALPLEPEPTISEVVREILDAPGSRWVDVDRSRRSTESQITAFAVSDAVADAAGSEEIPGEACGLAESFWSAGCLFGQMPARGLRAGRLHLEQISGRSGFRQYALQSAEGETPITSAAWIPGTRRLLVGTRESGVMLCDLTGGDVRTLDAYSSTAWTVAASGSGELLAAAGLNGRVLVWHAKTAELLCEFQACGSIRALAFSPDGTRLAAPLFAATVGRDGIRVWNLDEQRLESHWECTGDGSSLTFSADGRLLAANGCVWRTKDGTCVARLPGSYGPLAISPTGGQFVGGDPLELRDIEGGQPAVPLDDPRVYVTAVAFSQDGHTLALCTGDTGVRLWNPHSGREVAGQQLPASSGIRHAAFSPDDRELLVVHADGTLSFSALLPCAMAAQSL